MALKDLMELSINHNKKKIGVSKERIETSLPIIRRYIAYWREYPDMFVDFLCGSNPESFQLYFYQRVFLRAAMRHRRIYATFPRGYSKSFLSFLVLMLRCILYPNSHLFVTTGGKEQAASIAKEKTDLLCKLIPGLKNELNLERGKSKTSKDNIELLFKNGSVLNVMAARQSSRGKRANGGLMEECILIDQALLNEVIIPTMVIDRRLGDGSVRREESLNRSQIYITTAGWKSSFAYSKLIEILIQMVTDPDEAFVMGGTWRVPVAEGLQPKTFIQEQKLNGTYSDDSFAREFESQWSGDAENAFFSSDKFDKHRVLLQPEYEKNTRISKGSYYILGVDVGRYRCTTEVVVIKVAPQIGGPAIKSIVNLYTYYANDFEEQAIKLKKLYYKYQARTIVLDANGIGAGLVDFLVKTQVDPETGENLIPFGVEGGSFAEAITPYKNVRGSGVEENALYLVKANVPLNSEAYAYIQSQMFNGKLKFMIDENQAKSKLLSTKAGQTMDAIKRNEYLQPFIFTTILRNQMLNLVEEREGINIILKQSSKAIPKDKFSALQYGLYYIKQEEERGRKRRRGIKGMIFFT